MEKFYEAKLINDVLTLDHDIYYDFITNGRGFKLSDVVSWLSNIKEDSFRKLRNKVIAELDIINPLVETDAGSYPWMEVRKDIEDKIINAETFELSMKYELREGIFLRRDKFDPSSKYNIKAGAYFLVTGDNPNNYNEFDLSIWVPMPSDSPELSTRIKNKVTEIISDLKKNGKINGNNIVTSISYELGGGHYVSAYYERINSKGVSEAVETILSVLDGTKEILKEIKRRYS